MNNFNESPENNVNKLKIEDIPKYQSCFSREQIFNLNNIEKSRPAIMFPKGFYEATIQMCDAEKETNGVILISKNNEEFKKGRLPVCAMITTGYGSSTRVFSDEEKGSALYKLLSNHLEEIIPIYFHCHTKSTGQFWEDKFSSVDNKSLLDCVNNHNGYMHVLFTPKNIITFGKGNPQFFVTDQNNETRESAKYWKDKFNEILNQTNH